MRSLDCCLCGSEIKPRRERGRPVRRVPMRRGLLQQLRFSLGARLEISNVRAFADETSALR